jgi:hypothetical protein
MKHFISTSTAVRISRNITQINILQGIFVSKINNVHTFSWKYTHAVSLFAACYTESTEVIFHDEL